MEITAYDLATRFVGVKEVPGTASNPQVLTMLQLDQKWPEGDEVPWCSAFVNYVTWLLRLPRSKSLAARSWLKIGASVSLTEAKVGFDVVILRRAGGTDGPDVIDAPGHVGFFAGYEPGEVRFGAIEPDTVLVLGGNQGNEVSVARFSASQVLGIRRLNGAA